MLEQKIGKNRGNLHQLFSYPIVIDRAWSNKSGRLACCSQKSRTAWQNCCRKKRKPQFWLEMIHFLEQDRLLFVRAEIDVTEFRKKHPKEKRTKIGLNFFSRIQTEIAAFTGEFPIFWPRNSQLLGGITSKLAGPVSILGHIQAWPTRFLAQKTSVIFEKRWSNTDSFEVMPPPQKKFVFRGQKRNILHGCAPNFEKNLRQSKNSFCFSAVFVGILSRRSRFLRATSDLALKIGEN